VAVQTPSGPQTPTCPHCGFENESGGPVCGNCGRQLSGDQFPTASLAAQGTGVVKFAVIAAIVVGLGALAWSQGPTLIDALEALESSGSSAVEDPGGIGGVGGGSGNNGGGSGNKGNEDVVESPYTSVKELASALSKGGLDCKQVKTDHADDTIATGSCQAPGEVVRVHVQINIYFFPPALEAAKQIFSDRVFTYVHDANWFVVTQPETAKKVHDILGGRLVRAKD
jgi:hypothetical protein